MLIKFNDQMKSEYFREIELDTFPKKTRILNNQVKTAQHYHTSHSRNFKSEKRDLNQSIDPFKRSKQETVARGIKITSAKPNSIVEHHKEINYNEGQQL